MSKMSTKELEKYAGTKHKGLPAKKTNEAAKAKKDYDGDGKKESPKDEVWGSRAKAAAKSGKPFQEGAKPDFLDMDKDGNKKEPMKKAVKDKKVAEKFDPLKHVKNPTPGEKKAAKDVKRSSYADRAAMLKSAEADGRLKNEGFPTVADAKARAEKEKTTGKFDKKQTSTGTQYTRKSNTFTDGGDDSDVKKAKQKKKMSEARATFRRHVATVNEGLAALLAEDEEGKAKAITAASDIVNDYTTWMQRVGQYQTKSMIELADAIRADFGQAEADAFKAAVGPALAATLETLTAQREAISHSVAVLAGEASDMEPMGMDAGMEPDVSTAPADDMNMPPEDEFGASDAAAGGPETSGRSVRESRQAARQKRLAESHSLMKILSR
jgi:hypothetical protein